MGVRKTHMDQLIRVYEDLEGVLKDLKQKERELLSESTVASIDLKKLIKQLSQSKKNIERKIGNTILLEKQNLGKRLRLITSDLRQRVR